MLRFFDSVKLSTLVWNIVKKIVSLGNQWFSGKTSY